MKRQFSALAALATLAAAPLAAEEVSYIGVFIGSQHFGNENLNNINPGLSIGRRWDAWAEGVEYHAEAGVFYNSYEEVSPLALAGISTRLAELGPGELRVGASAGIAYYDELSESLEANYGIPNVGGFIPIVALTASYRFGGSEIRLTSVPPDTDTKAIVNLSMTTRF